MFMLIATMAIFHRINIREKMGSVMKKEWFEFHGKIGFRFIYVPSIKKNSKRTKIVLFYIKFI